MFKQNWINIPKHPDYAVCESGMVLSKRSNIILSMDKHNNVTVDNQSYTVQSLMGCVFLGNDITDPYRNRVLFKDGDSSHLDLTNLYVEDTSDLPGEIWAVLKTANNKQLKPFYQVSNLGRVKSIKHDMEWLNYGRISKRPYPEMILSQVTGDNGYHTIWLATEEKPDVTAQVHRLVASCFCYNPDPKHKTQVNHIDGDTSNNVWTNLEWCTPKENSQHAVSTGLRHDWKGRKLRYQVKRLETGEVYASMSDVDRAMGRCLGYTESHLKFNHTCTDADGNIWTLEVDNDVEQKIHTDGQHCKLSTFPEREFCSLSEASLAIGRWEGYIGDALNRGGVIRDLSGNDVKVELIGAAPCVERSREAFAKRKAAGLVSDKKERKSSEWASHKPLRHVETGQVFASMSDASRAMGKKAGYLSDCFAFDRTPVDASGNVWTFEQVDEDVKMERKEYYDRNKCYVEEYPGKEFDSLTLLSKEIGRDQGYVADRIQRGKPVLHIDGTQLHLHFADAAKEEEYYKKVAKCIEADSKPKQRMTKFACYFEEAPDRIFSNFSEAAFSLGKGASFIRDRFVKGDRIILDGKDLCLHLVNKDLEKEYQAKINK